MAGYKIKSGDTLSQIAKRNNMTIKQIMAMNPGIKDANKIRVGQTLKMPAKAFSGDSSMDESAPKEKKVNPYAGISKSEMSRMARDTAANKVKNAVKKATKKKTRNSSSSNDMSPAYPSKGGKMSSYYSSGGKVFTGR